MNDSLCLELYALYLMKKSNRYESATFLFALPGAFTLKFCNVELRLQVTGKNIILLEIRNGAIVFYNRLTDSL